MLISCSGFISGFGKRSIGSGDERSGSRYGRAWDEPDVQRMRLMLQAAPEGILLFDDGRCVDQNARAVALWGYSTGGELRGCTLSRLSAEGQRT